MVILVVDRVQRNTTFNIGETTLSQITLEAPESVPAYSYDAMPYPSHPYEASHPDHLYTIAKLFKVDAKLPDEASVLELGCASGGNIIPLAVQMPKGRFVGIDLSAKQIAEGQATIDALKLNNIKLLARDFRAIDESYGTFDYVICHGVFSWVPLDAQHRIFEICRDRMSANGIAYISYNCNPGWFMRGMIRQMMLHHTKHIKDPVAKVKQARALLAFIVESTEGQTTPYVTFLKHEMEMLSKHTDNYLYHDHLEENNHPMFFYEFMEMAQARSLQFLSESSLASMVTSNLSPKAAEALTKLTSDLYHRSQYTDFVTNRLFRQSLLVHRDLKVHRHLDETRLQGMYFAGNIRPEESLPGQDVSPTVEVSFKCANGRGIKTANAALKALMYTLGDAWPSSLTLPELCRGIEKRLSESIIVGEKEQISIATVSASHILQMMVRGDIEFSYLPDRFANRISDRPAVSSLARLQARSMPNITTQRHNMLNADPLTRIMLQVLDGSRSKADLVKFMGDLAAQGKITVNVQGTVPADMSTIHATAIEKVLEQLKRSAMLIS